MQNCVCTNDKIIFECECGLTGEQTIVHNKDCARISTEAEISRLREENIMLKKFICNINNTLKQTQKRNRTILEKANKLLPKSQQITTNTTFVDISPIKKKRRNEVIVEQK